MTKSEKEELAKVFRAFDRSGTGKLSPDDIKAGYLDYYGKVVSDQEVNKMFLMSQTGFIGYSQFVTAA